MSRSTPPVDPEPDVRGRTVVWSAGSPATRGSGRTGPGLLRGAGLVLAAVAAVFALGYAVHAWDVIAPPPAGAAVPLWLPDRLPADGARVARASTPSSHPSPAPTSDRVSPAPARASARTSRPRPAPTRAGDHPGRTTASGHGPSRRSGSDDTSGRSTSSSEGRHGGSSGSGSSGSGSGHHDSNDHGSLGGGGSDDGGSGGGGKGGGKDGAGKVDGAEDHGVKDGGGKDDGGRDHGGKDDGGKHGGNGGSGS